MSSLRITVIDDDPPMLAMLDELVREHFGTPVDVQGFDVRPTIDALAATDPSLVVLDLLLGARHSGLDLMRDMRRDHRLAPVPILVVTASRLGVQRYLDEMPWPNTAILMKPFSLEQFHDGLDALLAGTAFSLTLTSDEVPAQGPIAEA